MVEFEARTSVEAERVIVALVGECDLAYRETVTSELLAAVERSNVVVVDLADLEFLDSSGVHALVAAHHAALRRSGRVYVVNAAGEVAQVLALTGVGELMRPP
jgi:anti-anti-sigma factor